MSDSSIRSYHTCEPNRRTVRTTLSAAWLPSDVRASSRSVKRRRRWYYPIRTAASTHGGRHGVCAAIIRRSISVSVRDSRRWSSFNRSPTAGVRQGTKPMDHTLLVLAANRKSAIIEPWSSHDWTARAAAFANWTAGNAATERWPEISDVLSTLSRLLRLLRSLNIRRAPSLDSWRPVAPFPAVQFARVAAKANGANVDPRPIGTRQLNHVQHYPSKVTSMVLW